MKRLLAPEILDDLPAEDPAAIHSRRDLRRVNWWMGNARWMAAALREQFPGAPRRILELGAGDGTLTLEIARRLAPQWKPPIELWLLDRQDLRDEKTRASFRQLGWEPRTLQVELERWIENPQPAGCDLILTNLFLHHFTEDLLEKLFRAISRTSGAFIATEPKRWGVSLAATKLLGVIGCNYVTRHDARVSVQAGFREKELSALWPRGTPYILHEGPAGLATHIFWARKTTAPEAPAANPPRSPEAVLPKQGG